MAGRPADHNVFDPSKSSTFRSSSGQTWSITYGDLSSASGTVGKDVLDFGGLVIKNQAIELADSLSPSLQANSADGILGLAFGTINSVTPTKVRTPIENLIAQCTIAPSAEVVTAYLGSYKDSSDPDHGQSFYTIGYIDKDVVKSTGSDVYYTNIDKSNGFWQFPSESYTINGTVAKTAGRTAIADTGTSLALVDDAECKAIYDAIPGSKLSKEVGGYIFPKSTHEAKLPVIGFDIGGKTFNLKKEDLAYADVGSDMVYGGIQSVGDMPFNIYGDTFLKSVYAVFDCGRLKFGCAQRVEPDKTKAAPAPAPPPAPAAKATTSPSPVAAVPATVPAAPAPPVPAAPKPTAPTTGPAAAPPTPAAAPSAKTPATAAPLAPPAVAPPAAPAGPSAPPAAAPAALAAAPSAATAPPSDPAPSPDASAPAS